MKFEDFALSNDTFFEVFCNKVVVSIPKTICTIQFLGGLQFLQVCDRVEQRKSYRYSVNFVEGIHSFDIFNGKKYRLEICLA